MIKHCQKKQQLSRRGRQQVAPFVAFELVATSIAMIDIVRAKSVRRGHKFGWLLLALVQPIGPWLYFKFGQTKD
ncbi:hypothetical protein C5Z25_05680 [Lactobacillus sp. CBA3605]|uniref:PLD nuclease N-terminal domain-containing protein n=1 Tax=Lactobacillus sp. CBA3605 TaxID=2099788 RepID=UPI000CFE1828|nr:PLD nuclease N-terminal domain-containing protein [Lactobacillus sp. CBA3605]AVK61288.1 hypothetical protein C5Z25_05680 [Lactobacillus sp. CBA3605]